MPQLNDVGVILEVTVTKESDGTALDISTATTRQIILSTPLTNEDIEKVGVLTGDGSDGKMHYTTEAGVLDEVGIWKVQGRVVIGAMDVRTSVESFEVFANV